jgi:DNA-binding NarL/FixJ family response regulator
VRPPNGQLNDLATAQFAPPINDHLADGSPPAGRQLVRVRAVLTGSQRLRRNSPNKTFTAACSDAATGAFDRASDFPTERHSTHHVTAYHLHNEALLEGNTINAIAAIRNSRYDLPTTMLSGDELARQPGTTRNALRCGTQGFILHTSVLPVASVAVRFVKPTGAFAPVSGLLASAQKRPSAVLQLAQLAYFGRRKANKIRTYGLGMSESSRRVRSRNIMRKTGVVSRARTLAEAQQVWMNAGAELPGRSE